MVAKFFSLNLGSTNINYTIIILLLLAHSSGIWSARWSPTGNVIATGSLDRNIKVWFVINFTIIILSLRYNNIFCL